MADNNKTKRKSPMGPGGGHGLAPGEKPKNLKSAIIKIAKYMGKYKFAIAIAALFTVLGTSLTVMGPKVMGKATTELAEGLMRRINGQGGIDFDKIAKILLFTLALYAIGSMLQFLTSWIMAKITQNMVYGLRKDISVKISKMPMKYFEHVPHGEILSRITNDVDTIGNGLNQCVTSIIWGVVTMVGVITIMLTISPLMTLIAVVVVPLSGILIACIMKYSQKYFRTQQEYLGKINGQVEENFAGHLIIKAFNKEKSVTNDFNEVNDVLYESAWKSQFIAGLMQPIMVAVGNIGYTGVAISGGLLAIKGVIGIGDIQAFIQYVKNLTQPIQQIAQIMNQVQSMAAAAERVFEFLDEEEETKDADVVADASNVHGVVDFQNVKFGYDKENTIIHDFNAHVNDGQKIAIVGPTGAGKTTMVKLLMRFYDVDSGSIMLDGKDIREYSRAGLRENVAMVLQDTWLFSGTIMENIRYGRLDATDEEVIAAAKAAHVHHFIKTLPDGYNMVLNEEASNVSEGQRQLLTIARAILADKEILILDEATSSVDTRTEELIQSAMDNLMHGRTSFVIAHRLSTVKNSDLILVVNHGDIIEQGTHEELLELGGFYAGLYNSQFEEVS
ncbi:MAG: ABC transporter ATP-binding protein [Clostridiales bacterium]|nr:ABC transporter ATP-binding protein [Clostridiales bacterium]